MSHTDYTDLGMQPQITRIKGIRSTARQSRNQRFVLVVVLVLELERAGKLRNGQSCPIFAAVRALLKFIFRFVLSIAGAYAL